MIGNKDQHHHFENIADLLWLSQFTGLESHQHIKDEVQIQDEQKAEVLDVYDYDFLDDDIEHEEEKQTHDESGLKDIGSDSPQGIYTNNSEGSTGEHTQSATSFHSPKKLALSHYREWEKAFKSINLKQLSRYKKELDIDKTVENIASTQTYDLVFKKVDEKIFLLTLIIDKSETMELWNELINKFEQMLYTMGVFTKINLYYWDTSKDDPVLYSNKKLNNIIHPRSVATISQNNLVLVLSDCIAPSWKSGKAFQHIEIWSKKMFTSIMHMFPKNMWMGTMLSKAKQTHFTSKYFNPLNHQLGSLKRGRKYQQKLKIPVISFNPYALQSWAKVVISSKGNMISGIGLDNLEFVFDSYAFKPEITPQMRVERFYAQASPDAQKLAVYMSILPVDFQVTRILQEVKLPETDQSHLAEVYLGGIIQRTIENGKKYFDFYPEVRDIISENISADESFELMQNMSNFINNNLEVGFDFAALLADLNGALNGEFSIDEKSKAFAYLASNVLKRKGGLYAKRAKEIESRFTEVKTEVLNEEVVNPIDYSEKSMRSLVREKLATLGWQEEDIIEEYRVENSNLVFDILLKYEDNFLASIIVEKNLTKNNKVQYLLPIAKQLNIDFLYVTDMKDIYEYNCFDISEIEIDGLPSKDILLEQCKQSYIKRVFKPNQFYVKNIRLYQKQAVLAIQEALTTQNNRIAVSLLDYDRISVIIEILMKLKSAKAFSVQKNMNTKKVLVLCSSKILYNWILSSSKEYSLQSDVDIIYVHNNVEVFSKTQKDQYDLVIFDQASIVWSTNTLYKSLMKILENATFLAFSDNYNASIGKYFGELVYEYTLADSIVDGYSLSFDIQALSIEKSRLQTQNRHLVNIVNTVLQSIDLNEKSVIIYDDENLAKVFEKILKKKKAYVTYAIKEFITNIVPNSFLLLSKNKIMSIHDIDNIIFLTKVEKDMIWKILKGAARVDEKNKSREVVKIIDLYNNGEVVKSIIEKKSDYNIWLNKKNRFLEI